MRPLSVELRRGLRRFRYVTPWRLAADMRRAARLHRRDPRATGTKCHGERLVVTLTTVPDRAHAILPVLRSLLDQTRPADRIVLAWPTLSIRAGRSYSAPPALPVGVDLLVCEDQGPATKLLPALRAEPTALLVAVDDDVIYPVDFLATLYAAHRIAPDAALGFRGFTLQRGIDPRDFDHVFATAVRTLTRVDVLMGTWGYLVPPGALDDAVHYYDGWPPELRWTDDIWISGHLARRGRPRCVVPANGLPLETRASTLAALTDGLNRSGQNDRIAIDCFSKWW